HLRACTASPSYARSFPTRRSSDLTFVVTEEPEGWNTADFDASGWSAATEHSAREVSPKEGYDEIDWDPSAKLIWGPDLKTDNTIDRKSTRLNSSHVKISYAVFCLK